MITLVGESVAGFPDFFVKLKKYLTNCFRIDQLEFIGYEISLYVAKVREILQRCAESSVKINKLVFYTNGVVYSKELVELLNDFRNTTYPDNYK